jgi:hypothetical protein
MPHGWTIVPRNPISDDDLALLCTDNDSLLIGNQTYWDNGTRYALIKLDDDLDKAKAQVKAVGGHVKTSLADDAEKHQGKKPHPLPIP